MKLRHNQAGFTVFEVILVVVVLAALAVVGLRVMTDHSKAVNDSTAVLQPAAKSAGDVSSAPAINKASDLNKASDTLDQNNPAIANQADVNDLNSALSGQN